MLKSHFFKNIQPDVEIRAYFHFTPVTTRVSYLYWVSWASTTTCCCEYCCYHAQECNSQAHVVYERKAECVTRGVCWPLLALLPGAGASVCWVTCQSPSKRHCWASSLPADSADGAAGRKVNDACKLKSGLLARCRLSCSNVFLSLASLLPPYS